MLQEATWSLARGRVLGPAPFFVLGVLNVTPDSFYDGGDFLQQDAALKQAEDLLEQGADVLDVGGESTRPFSSRVEQEQELQRVLPILKQVLKDRPRALVSVDTYKSGVARQALETGALIINDVSACRFDPELLDVLGHYKPGYILMHSLGRPEEMQKEPRYQDVLQEIKAFFEQHLKELTQAGLPEENIVLDPGIGFGKTLEHNLQILSGIRTFFDLGRPMLIGLSNKSMWGKLLGLEPGQRQNATQVATALLAQKGVALHRVHEVDLTRQSLQIVRSLQERAQ
ncbi:MAG: dihydropteroate synthase [Thermodesulfobacteriota bacterium]